LLPAWYPTQRYPMGGVFCQEQARALAGRDDLDVVVLFVDRAPVGEWLRARRAGLRREAGVRVYRTVMPRLPGIWPLLYAVWAPLAAWRLARRYRFRPDLLHAHVSLPAGLAGALVRRLTGIPLVLTEHTAPFALLMRNPLAAWATTRAMRAADRVIAVSAALRAEIWVYPALRRPIDIIPNVVDTAAFAGERGPRAPGAPARLLFVGEMETERKGVPDLLAAVADLQRRGVAVRLDLLGGGRHLDEYRRLAEQLGVAAICRFHGVAPPAAVPAALAQADLLVLPSRHETFGVVLVEALAAGVPVVATRCGGPEEIVTPDVGVLVPPGDVPALATAIAEVLARPEAFSPDHLREVAACRYGQAAVARQLSQLYRQVVAD
jgi:glycosyltransferase involved in cell wall biosynthesis